MTVTELAAATFALLLAGTVVWRGTDDAVRPKVVLVRAEWSCRRSHPELDVSPVQYPDGSAGQVLTPVSVCDSWSRR